MKHVIECYIYSIRHVTGKQMAKIRVVVVVVVVVVIVVVVVVRRHHGHRFDWYHIDLF